MHAFIEHTDTFGGEAIYSWVERKRFCCDGLTDRQVIVKSKRMLGLAGLRTNTENFGDMIKLDFQPSQICQVMFITFGELDSFED